MFFPLSAMLPYIYPKDSCGEQVNSRITSVYHKSIVCWFIGMLICILNLSVLLSRIVNESRQVLQEPDFAQSLLRDPNTPIIRKSRGTSTQGTSTHASSTQLAMVDDQRSKAGSVHSKVSSYHGSLHRSRDGR